MSDLEPDDLTTSLSQGDEERISAIIRNQFNQHRDNLRRDEARRLEEEAAQELAERWKRRTKLAAQLIAAISAAIAFLWTAFELYAKNADKQYVKETIEYHSKKPHSSAQEQINQLKNEEIKPIKTDVADMKQTLARSQDMDELQYYQNQYQAALAEWEATGKRGRRPRKSDYQRLMDLEFKLGFRN